MKGSVVKWLHLYVVRNHAESHVNLLPCNITKKIDCFFAMLGIYHMHIFFDLLGWFGTCIWMHENSHVDFII